MIRVFEAFSGIGTQRMALERLNLPHQVVGISEIDEIPPHTHYFSCGLGGSFLS